MYNTTAAGQIRKSILVLPLVLSFATACSTDTRFGRWLAYKGRYNDAEHLPSVVVSNGNKNVPAFNSPEDPAFEEFLNTFRIDGVSFEDYFFSRDTNTLLILHRGELVYQRRSIGVEKSSIQPTYSVTKSIVSLLVDIAVRDKLISSLDDPVSKYLLSLIHI